MYIKKVKTAFKIADAVLDKNHSKNHIKFNYLSKIKGALGKLSDRYILRDNTGRVYIIVVDGTIKKIGGSVSKGGIKATLSFYQTAMQGGPSLRSYGIHLLIQECLQKGSKVEIYMITAGEVKAPVKGLFSEKAEIKKVAIFKEMEDRCKEDFKKLEGSYPEWNYQERGAPWPRWIHESYMKFMTGRLKRGEIPNPPVSNELED